MKREGGGGEVSQLSTAPSMRWARLIARMFAHGHRAKEEGGTAPSSSGLTSSIGHVGRKRRKHAQGARVGGGGVASSAWYHQGDGPASLLGRFSLGTEQCAVVVFLKMKSTLRGMFL